jgi:hypothetical protein
MAATRGEAFTGPQGPSGAGGPVLGFQLLEDKGPGEGFAHGQEGAQRVRLAMSPEGPGGEGERAMFNIGPRRGAPRDGRAELGPGKVRQRGQEGGQRVRLPLPPKVQAEKANQTQTPHRATAGEPSGWTGGPCGREGGCTAHL